VAQKCPHGFSPTECLICEALGTGDAHSTTTATKPAKGRRARNARADQGAVVPSQILAPDQRRGGRRRSTGGSLAAIAIGLVIAVIAAVALAGVVFTILRIFELVLVAAAAGWVGYHLGHFRGVRQR
jgi:hypothetical protein